MLEFDVTSWQALAGLAALGVFAGAVNTVAGGGSFVTIPALIFLGLPANAANATNRLGVFAQSVIASRRFHAAGMFSPTSSMLFVIPACLGALVGAFASVDIDEAVFRRLIGGMMLVMLGVMLLKPKKWLKEHSDTDGALPKPVQALAFFGVGLYGGFLQAGVGIFILITLVLTAGRNLIEANGIKTLLIAVFTIPALAVYFSAGLIHWQPGLALAVGTSVGAVVGTHVTVSWGPRFVRWVLVVVILVSSSRLLGVW